MFVLLYTLPSCHFFFSSSTRSNPRLSAAAAAAPAVAAGQCLLAEPPCCPYCLPATFHLPHAVGSDTTTTLSTSSAAPLLATS